MPLQVSSSLQVPQLQYTDTFYVSRFDYQCESKRRAVVAYAIDAPIASAIDGDSLVTIGDTALYTYTAAAGNQIEWILQGGTVLSAVDSLKVFWNAGSTGRVGVIERNAMGCKSDTAWLTVEIDLALATESTESADFTVSPNPAKEKITISRGNLLVAENYLLIDSKGKILVTQHFPSGKASVDLDVSKLAAGTYTLRGSSKQNTIRKLVIIR